MKIQPPSTRPSSRTVVRRLLHPDRLDGSVLPDSSGLIRRVYFQYAPGTQNADGRIWAASLRSVMSQVCAAMVGSPAVTVALGRASDARSLARVLPQAETLPVDQEGLSVWARDGIVAGRTGQGAPRVILTARDDFYQPADDQAVSGLLAAHPEIEFRNVDTVIMTDGNRVADDEHVFLSERVVNDTAERLRRECRQVDEAVKKAFQTETGQKVREREADTGTLAREAFHRYATSLKKGKTTRAFWTGELKRIEEKIRLPRGITTPEMWNQLAVRQLEAMMGRTVVRIGKDDPATLGEEKPPGFHVDMFLTPLGDNTVAVGSVQMAEELLKTLPKAERAAYNKRIHEAVGGKGDALADLLGRNGPHDGDPFGERSPEHLLDATSAQLEKQGFRVLRVPYLGLPQAHMGDEELQLPFLTYNNVLCDGHRVLLPQYGLDAFDRAARQVYEQAGWEVAPIGADPVQVGEKQIYPMLAISSKLGALRCLTQVLERSPEVAKTAWPQNAATATTGDPARVPLADSP